MLYSIILRITQKSLGSLLQLVRIISNRLDLGDELTRKILKEREREREEKERKYFSKPTRKQFKLIL